MSNGPLRRRPSRIPFRRRRGWAWVRLLRPVATLTGTATAVAFAFILEDGTPTWHEALRVGVVMAAVLGSAATLNDILDLDHDRDDIWRPPPRWTGTVRAGMAALVLAVVAVAASATLGWRSFLLTTAGLSLAYVYSARLKATPLSWLPLALAFAIVPRLGGGLRGPLRRRALVVVARGPRRRHRHALALKLPDSERDDEERSRNVLHGSPLTTRCRLPGAVGVYMGRLGEHRESAWSGWRRPSLSPSLSRSP